MSNSKNLLLIAVIFMAFMLYTQWQKDYAPVIQQTNSDNEVSTEEVNQEIVSENQQMQPQFADEVPSVSSFSTSSPDEQTPSVIDQSENYKILTTVETPLLTLKFAEQGASLVYAELKKYPVKKGSSEKVVLFDYRENIFVAQSGVISNEIKFNHKLVFNTAQSEVQVDTENITIEFFAEHEQGKIIKSYEIKPDGYDIKVTQKIINNSQQDWMMSQYYQLARDNPWLNKSSSFTDAGRYSFKGVGYFDSVEGYEKLDFDDLSEQNLKSTLLDDAWIAMVQHYFFAALIPNEKKVDLQTLYVEDSTTPFLVRYVTPTHKVPAQDQKEFTSTIFVGPKLQKEVPAVAKGLDLTVDYGVFTAISKPLFFVLEKIHSVVGNWGWSIILLTVLIKLLFFKLTEKQYNSMARMRKLQPRITALKDLHKGNKQKFNEEMMRLYQKEKVNPLGGCLPMLVQIPVFIALYWVLLESVELRQAPFMLWLQDLSTPDPYFILPAINAAAMIMTQRLSPTPGMDPLQQKIMKFMPIGFSIMFAFFQSGLVLYWAVNSVLSLAQQWVITKRIDAQ
ncbi:MAG: membrane protein insertase YidC, partial [Proteobacteria bacterium]|nr:membrane protein insertase YidC [Pseudomonadota bacterium]